jgi:hypothetical protein
MTFPTVEQCKAHSAVVKEQFEKIFKLKNLDYEISVECQ